MMKRPDSLAGKGHEYEELPHSRYTNPARPYYNESESGSGDSRPLPPPINKLVSLNNNSASGSRGSMENLCDAAASAEKPPTTHRRRQNPLYDSVEHEEVQDYKSKRRKSEMCPCLIQIVIGAIAVIALLLAILSLVGTTDDDDDPKTSQVIQPLPNNSDLQKALERIEQLETNYAALLQKYSDLQSTHSQDIHVIRQNISTYSRRVGSMETDIQNLETSLNTGLSDLESDLLVKIDDVSKMQGPPGVGNLTACQRRVKSQTTSLSWDTTETALIPESETDADLYVIMGIECTTVGGSLSRLVSQAASWDSDSWQYTCICSGEDATHSGSNRRCELVYWTCPRLS